MSGDMDERRAVDERMNEFRRYLRDHRGDFDPDPEFVQRVLARLARRPGEVLGQAALKLLPATLALVLVLAWLSFRAGADPGSAGAPSAGDDVIGWLIEDSGTGR